jgi:hypothetical protein
MGGGSSSYSGTVTEGDGTVTTTLKTDQVNMKVHVKNKEFNTVLQFDFPSLQFILHS